jgi:hypothetical protein
MMNRITPLTIVFVLISLLAACSGSDSTIPVTGELPGLQLEVQSPNGESAFGQADQAITYNYVVTNTGPQPLSGPVLVEDAPRQVFCPQLSTVGNLDNSLDFNESVTCTALYTPSESDRSAGSITSRARAIVGGVASNESTLTLGGSSAGSIAGGAAEKAAPGNSQTPSAIATVTRGAITETSSTETPLAIATASEGAPAGTTETPSVIPTATLGSADLPPGPTASVDTVNVVDLPAGTETIVLPGVVPAGGTIRYSIYATQGQQLTLSFIVTTNQLALTVTGPDGTVVKPGETGLPWSGSIATTGDYLIEVQNMDSTAVQPYVLELRRSPAS